MRNLVLGIVLGLLIAVAGTVFANFEGDGGEVECLPPSHIPQPTPEVTPRPTFEITATATPERTPCNRGVGNSGNDCDPGNSYGQGRGDARPAGEDRDENDTGPGNSGTNGNQNDRN